MQIEHDLIARAVLNGHLVNINYIGRYDEKNTYALIRKQTNVSKLAIFALYQNQTGTEIWETTVVKATKTNK